MAFDRKNYYAAPRENPIRRELCDFLKSKGETDFFEMTTLFSNYQLEGMAKSKHGWGKPTQASKTTPPVNSPAVDAFMVASEF